MITIWKQYLSVGLAALRSDLQQKITQDMALVLASQLIRLMLGLVSSAMLARGLGPDGLSVFSVIGATMSIALTISDFGLTNSAVRYIAGDLEEAAERAQQTANAYARLKVAGVLLIFTLTFVLASPLAQLLNLPQQSGPFLLRVAALGLVATAFSGTMTSILRGLHRFPALVVNQLSNIVITILLMGALFISGRLTLLPALVVGILAALVAATISFWQLPQPWRHRLLTEAVKLRGGSEPARRLLAFGKWLWISAILSILLTHLELLLLNQWMSPRSVGYYALALNIAFKAGVINQTLHTVLLPTVAALSGKTALLGYLRQSVLRIGLICLAVIVGLPLVRPFVLFVYGAEYAPAIGVLYALIGYILFDLLTIPLQLLAFPLNMPNRLVLAEAAGVITLLITSVVLIPGWGLYGAVAAKVAAKVVATAVIGITVALRLRAMPVHPTSSNA